MTEFKPGDRVKVVRESESEPMFNKALMDEIGRSGIVDVVFSDAQLYLINLDVSGLWHFPADMLELEEPK